MRFYTNNLRRRILNGQSTFVDRHPRARRLRALILATPTWVDRREMLKHSVRARIAAAATGEKYEVDHIIPICHPRVCGLNVPWNVQAIPERMNTAKGNAFFPDQMDLFTDLLQTAYGVPSEPV